MSGLRAIVIGAGSAGLANAAMLRGAGVDVVVLEAGSRVGESWRRRYRSLRLNTLRSLTGLPGMGLPVVAGSWPSGADFADYLQRYASWHGIRVRTGTRVRLVERDSDGPGWTVHTDGGVETAQVVVVATGNAAVPDIPDWPGRAGCAVPLSHSAAYREPSEYVGKRVLVIGSGNSATEIATELSRVTGHVWLAVRTPPLLVKTRLLGLSAHRLSVLGARLPDSVWDELSLLGHRMSYGSLVRHGLGAPDVGSHTRFRATGDVPVAERGIARAVRTGKVEVVPAVTGFATTRVRLEGGDQVEPDAVIAATGYRPSFPGLVAGLDVLLPDGRPREWAAPLSNAPGLFLVGAPSLQGDLREHGREARRVAAEVRKWRGGADASARRAPVSRGRA